MAYGLSLERRLCPGPPSSKKKSKLLPPLSKTMSGMPLKVSEGNNRRFESGVKPDHETACDRNKDQRLRMQLGGQEPQKEGDENQPPFLTNHSESQEFKSVPDSHAGTGVSSLLLQDFELVAELSGQVSTTERCAADKLFTVELFIVLKRGGWCSKQTISDIPAMDLDESLVFEASAAFGQSPPPRQPEPWNIDDAVIVNDVLRHSSPSKATERFAQAYPFKLAQLFRKNGHAGYRFNTTYLPDFLCSKGYTQKEVESVLADRIRYLDRISKRRRRGARTSTLRPHQPPTPGCREC